MDYRFSVILLLLTGQMLFFNAYAFSEPTKKKEKTVKMTTCRLASQLIVNNQRVCLFLGANNTQYREYMPYDAGECPRQYQCPYRPNENPFILKNVIKSIKKQFRGN